MGTLYVSLYLKLREEWRQSLKIPISEIPHFSTAPRRWLGYLGYSITGRVGTLRPRPDVQDLNLDSSEPIEMYPNYYYILQEDVEISPVDPDLGSSTISDISSLSSLSGRHEYFKEALVARDCTCIMSQAIPFGCDGAHLIRCSLGDKYIKTVTQKRRYNDDPIINDIDDVRNGLLVNAYLHRYLGRSVALLQVPNPFLHTVHIPGVDSSIGDRQYFLQNFDASIRTDPIHNVMMPHNAPAKQPKVMEDWPTDTLLAFVYGAVAMATFGTTEVTDILRKYWGTKFYSSEVGNNKDSRSHAEKKPNEEVIRQYHHAGRHAGRERQKFKANDAELCVMLFSGMELPPGDQEGMIEQRDEQRKKQSDEKVRNWLAEST
ncbi:hypothetical protein C8Q75DRAFT_765568 [Abortiporus biennis]|nr:hypothetical protein C8Q75DRAFT_765568 [Abortiporus biennis]